MGVVQNQPLALVNDLARASGVDLLQLHGCEDSAYAEGLELPYVRVLHAPPYADSEETSSPALLAASLARSYADELHTPGCVAVLVDTATRTAPQRLDTNSQG